MSWAGHVARTRDVANAYSILVGKSEQKRPLERRRPRRENNAAMDRMEMGEEVRTG